MDWQCNGNNNDPDARSCTYTCSTDSSNQPIVKERFYSDFHCELYQSDNNKQASVYSVRECGSVPSDQSCGVTVTRYSLSATDDYYCGSQKSPFKTGSSSSKKQYFLRDIDSAPVPIGDCYEVRNGYYSYSYKYRCGDMEETDPYQWVETWVYLGSSSCSGQGYLIENITSLNHTIMCEGGKSKGGIGYYASCARDNWDSYYTEYPVLYGHCTPFRIDPDERGNDGKTAQRPWNQNLRVVFSCNYNKKYPSAYFYIDEECKGDYLFTWDWNHDWWNTFQYGGKKCGRPAITNCGNTEDKTSKGQIRNVYV